MEYIENKKTFHIEYLGNSVSADLVESRENIVGKLYLSDGISPGHGQTDGKARDTLFTQRSVEHPLLAELLRQSDGAAEHSAEGHVLSEDAGGVIGCQGDVQGVGDGLKQGHLLRRA